jgi:alkylhydroperoxidase/carboxymuconolactone decarboxylase family protein YurZ
MSLAAEEETAVRDVTRALGLASHATRSLHAVVAHIIACMRSAGLTDDEIVTAVRALLPKATADRAVTYRAVVSTLSRRDIRMPD